MPKMVNIRVLMGLTGPSLGLNRPSLGLIRPYLVLSGPHFGLSASNSTDWVPFC